MKMRGKRLYAATVTWVFPILFVLTMNWLDPRPNIAIPACILALVFFVGLLCFVVFDRREDASFRYSRASRRMGAMAVCASLGGIAASLPLLALGPFLGAAHFIGVTLFLLLATIPLTLATIFFGLRQGHSAEPTGARRCSLAIGLFVVLFLVYLLAVSKLAPSRKPIYPCRNNLKNLGIAFDMFREENNGLYPQLSSRPGCLSISDVSGSSAPFVSEYLAGVRICLFCPDSDRRRTQNDEFTESGQELLDNSSYIYLGYAIKNEVELDTFSRCYRERVEAGLPFDEDLPTSLEKGSGGGDKLVRLREGVERYYVTDTISVAAYAKVKSEIPLLIERPGNHKPSVIYVLYLDGHVDFIPYPGKWPATYRTFEIIEALESMRSQSDSPLDQQDAENADTEKR